MHTGRLIECLTLKSFFKLVAFEAALESNTPTRLRKRHLLSTVYVAVESSELFEFIPGFDRSQVRPVGDQVDSFFGK